METTLENVKGRVAAAQSAAVGKANETAKASYDYVRENPWKMVGLAVAVGLVVGVLLHEEVALAEAVVDIWDIVFSAVLAVFALSINTVNTAQKPTRFLPASARLS